jgi:hypothetical protein
MIVRRRKFANFFMGIAFGTVTLFGMRCFAKPGAVLPKFVKFSGE